VKNANANDVAYWKFLVDEAELQAFIALWSGAILSIDLSG
jgi:hypothetical protein